MSEALTPFQIQLLLYYLEAEPSKRTVTDSARSLGVGKWAITRAMDAMEKQLMMFRTADGRPYRLVPLPLPDPLWLDDYRLPASYANFLIVNGGVLVPGAGSPKDDIARQRLQEVFPDREVRVIDCRALLSGHGSLHCVTMQFPDGYLRTE